MVPAPPSPPSWYLAVIPCLHPGRHSSDFFPGEVGGSFLGSQVLLSIRTPLTLGWGCLSDSLSSVKPGTVFLLRHLLGWAHGGSC